MTPDIANKRRFVDLFTAAVNGEIVEKNKPHGWTEVDPFDFTIDIKENPQYYRIKPKPVTRPWSKPEDVPGPVCWIRYRGQTQTCALIAVVDESGVHSWEAHKGEALTRYLDIENYEHSTDRKNWHPCTVTE